MQTKVPNLFVGVPCYGAADPHFEIRLFNFAITSSVPISVRKLVGSSLIPKARNQLVAEFRETSCTHLLFLDSDLTFLPADPLRLLSHGVPVVGGYYSRKRKGPPSWTIRTLPDAPPEDQATGLQQLAGIGSGFLLIERGVFEKIVDELGDGCRYFADDTGREEFDFFPVGVQTDDDGTRRYFGEDFGFCQICRDLGIPVYGDTTLKLGHMGVASYPIYGT